VLKPKQTAVAATVLLFFALTSPATGFAQRTLPPVDQATQQPDFLSFRTQLLAALARRDRDAVLAVVHADIKNSFGGNDGRKEFTEIWQLDSTDSALWSTLTTVLSLGGSFSSEDSFAAPYVFSEWPSDIDAFENIAVVARSVRVRTGPSTASAVVGRVSHAIVALGPVKGSNSSWLPVRLPDGKTGFMSKRFLRSSVDYRALFQKRDGRWQMTMLLAGD
jgi:hypothetical protein